jgi:hypothetical protein
MRETTVTQVHDPYCFAPPHTYDGIEPLPNDRSEDLMTQHNIRYNKDNPSWDAAMFTGVDQNTAGGKASSLTDDEAIAVWDALLSTLRLRVAK